MQRMGEGGSVSVTLTFATDIHHSWRQQMRHSCHLGVTQRCQKWAIVLNTHTHAACLAEKSLLVCYLRPYWYKPVSLPSVAWKESIIVISVSQLWSPAALAGTCCPCEVDDWCGPVRPLGNCLFILVTDSPPPVASPLPQVTFKPDLSTAEVHDENIKGPLKVRQDRWGQLMLSRSQEHCRNTHIVFNFPWLLLFCLC